MIITRIVAPVTLFFLMLLNCLPAGAQSLHFKNGAYRNARDFMDRKPLYESKFILRERQYSLYENRYFLISGRNPKVSTTKLDKYIWGIYIDGTFYLNASRLGMHRRFVEIGEVKKLACFEGPYKVTQQQEIAMDVSYTAFGEIGMLVSRGKVYRENKKYIHYVLNFKTGMFNSLNKAYISRVLEDYPQLLLDFKAEPDQDSLDVLKKYIQLVNAKNSPGQV